MTSNGFFENSFRDYSPESASSLLNVSKSGVSEVFLKNLEKYEALKLKNLLTDMKSDIFYDGTVYTGSCGLAMYYFLCSQKNDDLHLLKQAVQYINVDNLKGRKISFLCGDAGPLALSTVISYKLGSERPKNMADYETLAERLKSLNSLLNDSPEEMLYGKAGYLYSLLFVNKHIPDKEIIPASHIEKVINAILQKGKQFATQMKSQSPLLWQWHEKIYFGAAHGMAGILYMLMQARAYIPMSEMRSYVKPALDWLLSHQYPSNNFPSSLGSASGDRLVQWCHGAPGFVGTCLLAHETFQADKYLEVALKCGDLIWQRGLCTKGYSICHGVSGNAYAFIQLYQITKNAQHLYRACCFMDWCMAERPGSEQHSPDRPASLFEGIVGRLYLAEDMRNPLNAKFPAMTL